MIEETETDMALAALLTVANDIGAGIPETLVREAYKIQRKHQFDRDEYRGASQLEMQQLIDKFIDAGGAVQ